jgi:hypothetical protein
MSLGPQSRSSGSWPDCRRQSHCRRYRKLPGGIASRVPRGAAGRVRIGAVPIDDPRVTEAVEQWWAEQGWKPRGNRPGRSPDAGAEGPVGPDSDRDGITPLVSPGTAAKIGEHRLTELLTGGRHPAGRLQLRHPQAGFSHHAGLPAARPGGSESSRPDRQDRAAEDLYDAFIEEHYGRRTLITAAYGELKGIFAKKRGR